MGPALNFTKLADATQTLDVSYEPPREFFSNVDRMQ